MDDAAYWKRRAEEAERELQRQRDAKARDDASPRCKNCGRGPGVYAGWCSECVSDHDL